MVFLILLSLNHVSQQRLKKGLKWNLYHSKISNMWSNYIPHFTLMNGWFISRFGPHPSKDSIHFQSASFVSTIL